MDIEPSTNNDDLVSGATFSVTKMTASDAVKDSVS